MAGTAQFASPGRTGLTSQAGFTLAETLVVAALIAVMSAIAIPVTVDMIRRAKADSAAEVAMRAISAARARAVAERRNVQLEFVAPDRIQLFREEVDDDGVTTGTTLVAETRLEGGQEFLRFPGQPDTPDLFGAATATTFGGTPPVMFTTDGSLVDSAGDVVNGSVFFGVPNQPDSARAVTILGVSGLMQIWKWRGASWMH